MLVAPVIEPGKTSREVYFPAGKWYSIDNPAKVFVGPIKTECEAPLHEIPVFAKAGTFIPMADYEMRSTEKYDPSRFLVKYYTGAKKSEYSLFDDNRTSTGTIEDKKYQLINFLARENEEYLAITMDTEGWGYAGMPEQRNFTYEIIAVEKAPRKVEWGNSEMKAVMSNAIAIDLTEPKKYIATNNPVIAIETF